MDQQIMYIVAIMLLICLYFDYRLICYTRRFIYINNPSFYWTRHRFKELLFACVLFTVALLYFGGHFIIGVLR